MSAAMSCNELHSNAVHHEVVSFIKSYCPSVHCPKCGRNSTLLMDGEFVCLLCDDVTSRQPQRQ